MHASYLVGITLPFDALCKIKILCPGWSCSRGETLHGGALQPFGEASYLSKSGLCQFLSRYQKLDLSFDLSALKHTLKPHGNSRGSCLHPWRSPAGEGHFWLNAGRAAHFQLGVSSSAARTEQFFYSPTHSQLPSPCAMGILQLLAPKNTKNFVLETICHKQEQEVFFLSKTPKECRFNFIIFFNFLIYYWIVCIKSDICAILSTP